MKSVNFFKKLRKILFFLFRLVFEIYFTGGFLWVINPSMLFLSFIVVVVDIVTEAISDDLSTNNEFLKDEEEEVLDQFSAFNLYLKEHPEDVFLGY
jgi:hypothetical protein